MSNRYICDSLNEMRSCWKTRNFAPILGLIEDVQSLANRMESALEDQSDVLRFREMRGGLKDEIIELIREKNKLNKELGKDVTPSSVKYL